MEARRELRGSLRPLHFAYGPINKTTISETKDGNTIRRMPNIVNFRDDPDGMLVLALEEYDEETDTAKKAAIMSARRGGQARADHPRHKRRGRAAGFPRPQGRR